MAHEVLSGALNLNRRRMDIQKFTQKSQEALQLAQTKIGRAHV